MKQAVITSLQLLGNYPESISVCHNIIPAHFLSNTKHTLAQGGPIWYSKSITYIISDAL